jgi:hypothetical protein
VKGSLSLRHREVDLRKREKVRNVRGQYDGVVNDLGGITVAVMLPEMLATFLIYGSHRR